MFLEWVDGYGILLGAGSLPFVYKARQARSAHSLAQSRRITCTASARSSDSVQAVIDAEQPARPVPRWWRIWQGPTLGILTGAACVTILWASVTPVITLIYSILAFWALVIIGVAWLAFTVIGWFLYRTARRSLIAPALVVATAVLVVFSVPFRVGFAVSENRLADAAATCSPSAGHSRIGVYSVRRVAVIGESGCQFYTSGGFLDDVGVVYLPDGPSDAIRARFESIDFSHISGDWYRFSAGW